jgi:stage II sporulation protein D
MKLTSVLTRRSANCLAAAIIAISTLPFFHTNSYAAVPKLDSIRVALFIDSTKFKSIEPVVTLSSTSGLDIGIRSAAATKIWISVAGSASVRGSLDQFGVMMLETSDFNAAKTLYAKLSTMSGDSYVISRMKQGKSAYQVFYGSYASFDAATAAKAQALQDANVVALVKGAEPVLTGPLHFTAGSYGTEAEAARQVGVLSQAGLNADLAIQEDAAGKLWYSAWVGNEATQEQLNGVQLKAASLLSNVKLQPALTTAPYLVKRSDVTEDSTGTGGIAHYAAGGSGVKTWIHPKQAGITVKERSTRIYRGDIELSSYNGKLAVVNEVPFEQYLYAVVSSELSSAWPIEALKAQAVAARTYALNQGLKYEIAQVSDTTLDQAYYGMQKEFPAALQAVDATKDEVLVYNNKLISPFYSSNAGGMTADPSEVWGNPVAYLKSVPSPDEGAAAGKALWLEVKMASGTIGYVHSSYLKNTGQKSPAGLALYEATEAAVNVRMAPYVDNTANPSIAQLNAKERVELLGQEKESNAYSWIRGPYDAAFLETKLANAGVNLEGGLQSLEVTKRGPSGRVMELKANGQVVKVSSPDGFRSLLGGLPSTRFEIEVTGSYTVNGAPVNVPAGTAPTGSMYVLSGKQTQPVVIDKSQIFVLGASGEVKPMPQNDKIEMTNKKYLFKGTGYGHGLGMSQWGAKGYAELGYDYKKILQTYYSGVNIVKE